MSVAQILEEMAQNAGNAARSRGAIYGNLIAGASQVPGQILDDRERQAALDRRNAQLDAQAGYARDAANRAATKDAQDQAQQAKAAKDAATAHEIIKAYTAGTPNDPSTNNLDAGIAKAKALDAPEFIPKLREMHATELAQAHPKPLVMKAGDVGYDPTTNQPIPGMSVPEKKPDYTIGNQRFSGDATPIGPRVITPPAAPVLGSPADAVTRYANEQGLDPTTMTTAQVNAALKQHTDATQKTPVVAPGGIGALYGATDPVAIAAQIRAGKMPPDISQYGRPVQGAIASVLAKQGPNSEPAFDLASAQRTWKAQLKLNATMNGAQQVRLDESIRSGLAMYDKVDEIAAQWDGMGIGPLSRANLAAARDGLKGKAAASVANQLTGQIGQLTSDIATIEQGGLTPTNESRAVAEKSMQDWWGKGTITDMTAQGRANMQIRHLARNTQDVMVPGNGVDTRPAQPATPAPAASAVPANVAAALKGIAPGIHTLSDGSRWMVNPDGSVTKP